MEKSLFDFFFLEYKLICKTLVKQFSIIIIKDYVCNYFFILCNYKSLE